MMLGKLGIVAPTYWEHYPALHDKHDDVVGTLLAKQHVIPP